MPLVSERLTSALADRYRIEHELGQGGMATVYLAHDLRHDRKVAVKVLRPELSAVIGAERFLAEIKTTANLQHPHILPLHDSGEADSFLYYVMPYVEGESLRDRINREKQLPLQDAERIATEVASALDYAHRHNVIHRDIKPENILLHDGSALVADFGIALAASRAGGVRITETGMSIGTPQYMSPEQAMGERDITARSDIYALGAVTYEMLIGEPPFSGPTAQAIVARVLTEEPRPLIPRRHTILAQTEDAVLTALEKLPADRFGSAREFSAALAGDRTDRHTAVRRRPGAAPVPASLGRRLPLLLGLVLLMGIAYLLGTGSGGPEPPPVNFGRFLKVTWDPGLEVLPAISPDGRSVAYASGGVTRTRIFVRSVAGGRGIPLTDDTGDVQSHPQWSPDGSRVLFLARGGVFSAPASGGLPRPEVPPGKASPVTSAIWSPDGASIGYTVGDSLFIRDERNQPRTVAGVFEPNGCSWSADGAFIACSSGNAVSLSIGVAFGNISPSKIVTIQVRDGTITSLTDSLSLNQSPVWSPDGRWVFFVSNRSGRRDIYGQPMSGGRQDGPVLRLTTGLDAHTISLSADGKFLAYASLQTESNIWAVPMPVTPAAIAQGATQLTHGSQSVEAVDITTDGRWLLYDSNLGGNMDAYRMALPDGAPERLTTDPADDFGPAMSPDGREIAFHSWRGGFSRDIYVMPLDGGPVQRVMDSPLQEASASWGPRGDRLVTHIFSAGGGIWVVRRVNGKWQQPVERLDRGFWPSWSPDGTRIAFSSDMVDGSVWVMQADSGSPRLLVDSAGPGGLRGTELSWSEDGQAIYIVGHDQRGAATFWAIPVSGAAPSLLLSLDRVMRGGWGFGGGRLVYSVEDRRSDVWVIEVEWP